MNLKLLAGLACGMALLLGSCSGDNAPGTTPEAEVTEADFGGNGGNGGSGSAEPTELDKANAAHSEAESAVALARAAVSEAERANTEEARDRARALISAAFAKLADAVAAAEEAVEAARNGGVAAALGAAARVKAKADNLLNAQTAAFASALDSLAWYGRHLVRYQFANGEAFMPREGANVVSIKRIPRTKDDDGDGVQEPNPDAFTSTTFKDVMYSAGDMAFSDSGDEFKVDGYVGRRASSFVVDQSIYTGLKLTETGLVIRTGGTGDGIGRNVFTIYMSDFTDFRRDLTQFANDGDGDDVADALLGRNGWDLAITFDEPRTLPVVNGNTSWTGNGDFYWKGIVPADPSQLDEDGDYYDANAFKQPNDYRDLGTYEVWLSSHVGLNANLEPASGSASYPDDDEQRHLKYAAYGLFVYIADTETFQGSGASPGEWSGRLGRVNTIHFGYSAFGTGDGQKTADIGDSITNGKFVGYALAYEVSGDSNPNQGVATGLIESKLMRGDVNLTVNIPKGSGSATLEGTINNFQRWSDENNYWTAYADSFSVALESAEIGESGTFSGETRATPAAGLNNNGEGFYRGSFYGPRADRNDLEVAGSWTVGPHGGLNDANKNLYGSFGAKQRPSATQASGS